MTVWGTLAAQQGVRQARLNCVPHVALETQAELPRAPASIENGECDLSHLGVLENVNQPPQHCQGNIPDKYLVEMQSFWPWALQGLCWLINGQVCPLVPQISPFCMSSLSFPLPLRFLHPHKVLIPVLCSSSLQAVTSWLHHCKPSIIPGLL